MWIAERCSEMLKSKRAGSDEHCIRTRLETHQNLLTWATPHRYNNTNKMPILILTSSISQVPCCVHMERGVTWCLERSWAPFNNNNNRDSACTPNALRGRPMWRPLKLWHRQPSGDTWWHNNKQRRLGIPTIDLADPMRTSSRCRVSKQSITTWAGLV